MIHPPSSAGTTDPSPLRRARVAILATFGVHAAVAGTIGARLPSIKAQAGLSDGELGLALAIFAAGLLLGTRLAGAVAGRGHAVIRVVTPLLGLALTAPGLAGSLPALALALLVVGLLSGLLDVAMNANAVELERRLGRPILAGIHAAWSGGMLLAAAAAAPLAARDVPVGAHFAAAAALLGIVAVVGLRDLLPAGSVPAREGPRAAEGADRPLGSAALGLIAIAVVAFGSFLAEGAAADWSAVFVAQETAAPTGAATLAFVAFSLGMTLSRLVADRVWTRLGPVRTVRAGGIVAAAGLAAGLLAGDARLAIVSFAVLGLALAPIVPIAFSAAGNRRASSHDLGWVVTAGYLGSIVGPVAIGLAATWLGLRAALFVPVVVAVVVAATAGSVRAAAGGPGSTPSAAPTSGPTL